MGKALEAIWRGIVASYEDLFRLIALNLIWTVLSIPFFFIIMFVTAQFQDLLLTYVSAGLLLLLVLNPFTTGLYYYTNQIAHEERVDFSVFWTGIKLYWRKGLVMFFINLVLVTAIVVNIIFYLNIQGNPLLPLISIVWFYALLAWVCVQIYMGPLIIEQKNKRVLYLFRNALLLMADNIFFTLTLLLAELVIIALALIVPPIAVLLAKGILAMIENFAIAVLLAKYEEREKQAVVQDS